MIGHAAVGGLQFVGRERELASVTDAALDVANGHSRLVLVRGAAGMGKTTLCEHAAPLLAGRGFAVTWGRGWPDGGAPPLWPWTSVLRDLGGDDAAAILDEGGRVGAVDADRFARFAAVADVLRGRASKQPVAIVLDDAHLADAAATLLTRFVVRTLHQTPLLVVVTRRTDGDGPDETRRTLDELERDATVIALEGFDDETTASMLAAHGLRVESYGLAPALARLTGGNPLLLVRAVAGRAATDGYRALDHVIERSLGALSPEHRDVVALAAILGVDGALADVLAMVGGDPADVVEALERASDAGLVELADDRWSFTHDVVRRAALGVLTTSEAMDAHVRALGVASGDDRPGGVARRSHHALAAAGRSDSDARRAVAECRHAARVLARGFDYERAATLLESAVELVERRPPPDHLEVVLEWADALLVCGRLADARRAYARADELATRAGDPVARARAALGLGGVWLNEHRSAADRARVLGRQRTALAALAGDSSDVAIALRARLGLRLTAEAVYDGAPVAPVLTALAESRATGDLAVLAEGLSLTHHALLAPEHLEARQLLADELIDVSGRIGDDLRLLFGLLWRTVDLFLAGDASATRDLAELRTRADAVGCRSIGYIASAIDVMQLMRDGRLDEAEAAAHASFEQGVDVGDADATGYYGAHLLAIRWFQDRDGELADLARDIATSSTLVVPEFAYRAAAATIAARAGRTDQAATLLSPLRRVGLAALPRSSTWLSGIVNVVEVAAITGDSELAQQAYPLLVPFAGRPVMPSLAIGCLGSVERALGLAAATYGDRDRAVEHLRRAVAANIRLGNRPMTAISRADLADVLADRDAPGDRAEAIAAFRTAAAAAADIDLGGRAAAWTRRADALDSAARTAVVLRPEGGGWTLDTGVGRAVLPDLVGFRYLHALVARPDDEVSALELCGGLDIGGAGQEVVDPAALRSYRDRVAALDDQLAEAQTAGPRRRVERLERERAALRDELSTVLARSGRARRFVDAPERARTAVRKAIARALDVLAASDAAIADDLRATIVTGRTCAYRPDPGRRRVEAG